MNILNQNDIKVPVTILTGYLGSGKTTFINYLLKENHGNKFAIIENEYGEVGIDDGLVLQTNEEIIEMMNGCICCTVRKDLVKTIKKLIETRKDMFNHIIIETTGLADPAPVAQTFFVDEEISNLCYLDSIVTFVDSKFTLQHLDEVKPEGVENEANEQVAFADLLILNKTDLVSEEELTNIKNRIKEINIHAPIIESQFSKVPIEKVIDVKAFDLKRTLEMDDSFLNTDTHHNHDNSITSFGIHIEGQFKIDKLNNWLNKLLMEKGQDIYRSKGILSIVGSNEKYVYQSVHMIMKLNSSKNLGMNLIPWQAGEKRINKFCFIGKNLEREKIIKELEDSLVSKNLPEPGPVPKDKLNFEIGDIVVCKQAGWSTGIIRDVWYREDEWETGKYIPYEVLLLDGDRILVDKDSKDNIRLVSELSAKDRYELYD